MHVEQTPASSSTHPDGNGKVESVVSVELRNIHYGDFLAVRDSALQVKKNSMVTFSGAFSNHPLHPGVAGQAGTADNPIKDTLSGTTMTFTFANVGTFGYWCGNHYASNQMYGAINVVQ